VIVVDTNLLAYAVLPGERTEAALAVAGRDPDWVAPALWRWELRNVLATAMRVRKMHLRSAVSAFGLAEQLVTDADLEASTEECLRVAARGGVSAYDAEFVFVAEQLELPLVTADRRLAKAFPGLAISPEEFATRR
jgi:predicted nucleic acid-binding protein